MPMGSHHEAVGLLLRNRRDLILEVDDGGTWRLEASSHAHRLLGLRVRVTGVRDSFDLLAVDTIEQVR